jgi:hypothetical protein
VISAGSTVLRKLYNKGMTRIGIEYLKVGDYIRTISQETGDYSISKVTSVVKLTLPRYEITTTCFDTLHCSNSCRFMTLDGLYAWSPNQPYDHSTRLCKRDAAKLLTPFIKTVKLTGIPTVFYDILIENEGEAVLVDGYAKKFGS